MKLVEVKGVKKWKVEKILNKKNEGSDKILDVMKGIYSGIWHMRKKKRLENIKKVIAEFEGRLNAEVRQ